MLNIDEMLKSCVSDFAKKIPLTVMSCGLLSDKHRKKIGFTFTIKMLQKHLLSFILTSNRE